MHERLFDQMSERLPWFTFECVGFILSRCFRLSGDFLARDAIFSVLNTQILDGVLVVGLRRGRLISRGNRVPRSQIDDLVRDNMWPDDGGCHGMRREYIWYLLGNVAAGRNSGKYGNDEDSTLKVTRHGWNFTPNTSSPHLI